MKHNKLTAKLPRILSLILVCTLLCTVLAGCSSILSVLVNKTKQNSEISPTAPNKAESVPAPSTIAPAEFEEEEMAPAEFEEEEMAPVAPEETAPATVAPQEEEAIPGEPSEEEQAAILAEILAYLQGTWVDMDNLQDMETDVCFEFAMFSGDTLAFGTYPGELGRVAAVTGIAQEDADTWTLFLHYQAEELMGDYFDALDTAIVVQLAGDAIHFPEFSNSKWVNCGKDWNEAAGQLCQELGIPRP